MSSPTGTPLQNLPLLDCKVRVPKHFRDCPIIPKRKAYLSGRFEGRKDAHCCLNASSSSLVNGEAAIWPRPSLIASPAGVSLCTITALHHIGPDEVIFAGPLDDTPNQPSIQIVGQFDGSSLREEQIGGAGYVVYAIEGGQSRVIAPRAVALQQCSDNIEAEILACLFLVEEVSVLVKQPLIERGISPRVVIQGDILPVIKYFNLRAAFAD